MPREIKMPRVLAEAAEVVAQAKRDTAEIGKEAFERGQVNVIRQYAERMECLCEVEGTLNRSAELFNRLGLSEYRSGMDIVTSAIQPIGNEMSPGLGALLPGPDDDSAEDDGRWEASLPPSGRVIRHFKGSRPRLPDGPAHLAGAYLDDILSVLGKHSGAVPLETLWAEMEPNVAPWLNVSDHGWLPNHKKERWKYAVQWALTILKKQGKVENPRRGFWKLRRG